MSIWAILTSDGSATPLSREEPTNIALPDGDVIMCTASVIDASDDNRERVRLDLECDGTTATLLVTSKPGCAPVMLRIGVGADASKHVTLAVGVVDPAAMLAPAWE